MRNIFTAFLILLIIMNFSGLDISADDYNYNQRGEAVYSQSGYIPVRAVSGSDLSISEFSSPEDIFLSEDVFYIADSGNNRIVSVNNKLDKVIKIYQSFKMPDGSETFLKNPTGIFADSDRIYIADSENSRILVTDYNSNVILEIKKPDDSMYSYKTFAPLKVSVDNTGNIYAVASSVTSGAVMFDSAGNFLGFYGANRTERPSDIVIESIRDFFRTDEKKLRRRRSIPSGISNLDIDSKNFIYTCTQSDSTYDTIKKINSAGNNLFMYNTNIFGDYPLVYSSQEKNMFCDIDSDDNGNINCLDFRYGRIFQYDKNCNLLFIFGGKSGRLGGFERVSAIESSDDNIYILDSMKQSITVFEITDFGRLVMNAQNLYDSGYYEQSLEVWQNVLRRDSGYLQAYRGIASVLLIQGNYADSMKYAHQAELTDIYNKAFEGWRTKFLSNHFGFIIIVLFILILLIFSVYRKISGIKIHNSSGKSIIILLLFFFASVVDGRFYGIQFRIPDRAFNIIPYFVFSIGIFLLWCISNRAGSIFLDGCGTFRNIFTEMSESIVPYIAQLYINTLLSHILIQDEYIFMQVIRISGIVWTAILIFRTVSEVHHYSFKRTVVSILMTIAGMIIMLCLAVLILSLFQQIYIFVLSLITEISYRIRS